jgi:hypothetical protein
MSELKCVNTESWKQKIEMFEYKKLECLNIENWNVYILKTENWNVWLKHPMHMGKKHYNIICSHKHPHKVIVCFEHSKLE